MRHSRPYTFIGQTTSLCEDCLDLVPAKILREGDQIYYQKRCPSHGVQKTLISTDAAYYDLCRHYYKPGDIPFVFDSRTERGCPYDCGLCPDHEQHSCLALIEINEDCNLSCPVCFADSSPARRGRRDLAEIERMLDHLVAAEGHPDLLQISGGEPTLHPDFFEILAAAKRRPIRHVMINTNGIRLARDPDFAARLAEFKPGIEVYLQFDSLRPDVLRAIRGADLTHDRRRALENLERYDISTTLVAVLKRGHNDDEIGDIIRHGLQFRCVRGVTFQPIQDAGRNVDFDKNKDRLLLSDVRRGIVEQSGLFDWGDVIPLPCNPEAITIGYALRNGSGITPLTGLIPRDILVDSVPNAVTFEKYPELRQRIFDAYSLATVGGQTNPTLHELLCCLPLVEAPSDLGYESVFRVVGIQFLDRFNFCLAQVKRSCIHFVTPDSKIIPFDTYNLFYRDNKLPTRKGSTIDGR